MYKFTINNTEYEIRRWGERDSVSELTELLHRSYKRLADMGLNFLATHQDDIVTKRRLEKGESFVISNGEKLIAAVTLYKSSKSKCEWYNNAGVSYFGQFAVESEYQNCGIGSVMMKFLEVYAAKKGVKELSLDTSEQALHLIEYYKKRGYRFIQFHKWDEVNYRSVVMSKKL
jgi:GNAT superfamily N-acetyltransferase